MAALLVTDTYREGTRSLLGKESAWPRPHPPEFRQRAVDPARLREKSVADRELAPANRATTVFDIWKMSRHSYGMPRIRTAARTLFPHHVARHRWNGTFRSGATWLARQAGLLASPALRADSDPWT